MAEAGASEQDVAWLLSRPLADFTAARNERARTLAAEGESERAQAVRHLRKPPAVVWALNQLAHRHPELLKRLVQAGERLRRAQRGALASGSGSEFRAAMHGMRSLEEQLADTAAAILRGERRVVSSAMRAQLQTVLHDVAIGDPKLRRLLLAGALFELDPALVPVAIPAIRFRPTEARPSARVVREPPSSQRLAREAERVRTRKARQLEAKASALEVEAQRLEELWQRQLALAGRTKERADEARRQAKAVRQSVAGLGSRANRGQA